MTLAHEQFGHRGAEKCTRDIQKHFYWPNMWDDIQVYCKSCPICQKASKKKPKPNPMVLREISEVPSEVISVDIVGPLPKAKGGLEYLLTCVDQASRWPEAIPLKKATSSIIIAKLTEIFCHVGFPATITGHISSARPLRASV